MTLTVSLKSCGATSITQLTQSPTEYPRSNGTWTTNEAVISGTPLAPARPCFKSAQLIANSKDADKVIFLIDRIELGTQSLKEYRGFAEENEDVQATENTHVLIAKLKSKNPTDTLIVTSIQKMSNIKEENGMKAADFNKMIGKRIVFIVDEALRSTFGEMLHNVKSTFPNAIFFGFTGTPIHI
jgi:type I restriction enzyme R subunit